MKTVLVVVAGRLKKVHAVGAVLALAGAQAHAALPAIIGTTIDSVETDALALADLVWPVLVGLFGAVLLMKLFKRLSSKI